MKESRVFVEKRKRFRRLLSDLCFICDDLRGKDKSDRSVERGLVKLKEKIGAIEVLLREFRERGSR